MKFKLKHVQKYLPTVLFASCVVAGVLTLVLMTSNGSQYLGNMRGLAGASVVSSQQVIKYLDKDYGGVSYASFQKAVEEAKSHFQTAPDTTYTIKIPTGTFSLSLPAGSTARGIIDISDVRPGPNGRLIIKGSGRKWTFLSMPKEVIGIYARNAERITISDLAMTVPSMTVTQGVVSAVAAGSVTLDIHAGFPTPKDIWVNQTPYRRYLREYTSSLTAPRLVSNYNTQTWVKEEQILWRDAAQATSSPHRWVVFTEPAGLVPPFVVGDLIGVKSKHMQSAYWFLNGKDILFNNIEWMHRTRGVFRGTSSNVTIRDCKAVRAPAIQGQTPAMSSPEGGPQFGQPGEPIDTVRVENCQFIGTGDDAIGLFEATNVTIKNTKISDSFGRGIYVYKSPPPTLINNSLIRAPLYYEEGDPFLD